MLSRRRCIMLRTLPDWMKVVTYSPFRRYRVILEFWYRTHWILESPATHCFKSPYSWFSVWFRFRHTSSATNNLISSTPVTMSANLPQLKLTYFDFKVCPPIAMQPLKSRNYKGRPRHTTDTNAIIQNESKNSTGPRGNDPSRLSCRRYTLCRWTYSI